MITQDYTKLEITKVTATKLEPTMRSWKTIYAATRTLKDSEANLLLLANMLSVELQNPLGPRAQIMMRLHMRLNAMRQRLEFSRLIPHASR